jgi:DNA-binding MarR family transcriptional regulator
MGKLDVSRRFGFLVTEIARLYSQQFDRLATARLGLSQAQCRVLGVLAAHGRNEALSQAELAQRLGLSTMAVAKLCDRMAAGGWIERRASASDGRVNELHMKASARKALERAIALGDALTARSLASLSPAEQGQLLALLAKARAGVLAAAADGAERAGASEPHP